MIFYFVVEDGKDGIKFYTDANYFFELWRSEMLQSTEKAEKVRRGGLKGSRLVVVPAGWPSILLHNPDASEPLPFSLSSM